MVDVDDFKLSGPKASLSQGWKLTRKGIHMDDPLPMGLCLGCNHHVFRDKVNGKDYTSVKTEMKEALQEALRIYTEGAAQQSCPTKFDKVSTPFVHTDTPDPDGDECTGKLAKLAAPVFMKILCIARICRYDLLKPIGALTNRFTRWTKRCDKQFHRLMRYIHCLPEINLQGYIGDSPDKPWLELFGTRTLLQTRITDNRLPASSWCSEVRIASFRYIYFGETGLCSVLNT